MAAGDRAGVSDSVDQAMNQVLAAEREARDVVERCRAEAVRILAAAEERARRIAQRTERRIQLAHRIADQSLEHALRELRGPRSGPEPAMPEAVVRALQDRAVDDLVAEILGGKP